MTEKLITGATGFLGSYLLHQLLRRGERPYILVRAKDGPAAQARLRAALNVFGEAVDYPPERILLGDVTREALGLSAAALDELRGRRLELVHCAALPKFDDARREALYQTNVVGALHAGRLALELGAEHFLHVSTLYVCGQNARPFGEDDLSIGQSFRNPYEETKHQAEVELRALFRGSPTALTVLRPGIIVGDSRTGAFPAASMFGQFVSAFQRLKRLSRRAPLRLTLPVSPDDGVHLIPVDYFAEFALAVLDARAAWGKTYHLQSPRASRLGDLNRWLQAAFELDAITLDPAATAAAAASPGLPYLLRFYGDYLTAPPAISAERAQALAKAHGLRCPELDGAVVGRYVERYRSAQTKAAKPGAILASQPTPAPARANTPRSAFSKPELLAPAGARDVLEAVVEAGADAVYLSGKRFAMRQHAQWLNFDDEELRGAAEYLHARGKKLYVTVNNLYTGRELELLPEYLEFLRELGADALIVTDFGLLRLLRRLDWGLPLFASVMMQAHSAEGVRELQGLGIRRVIASQNLPLHAVRRIQETTGVEIEHFIHGDTCAAIHSFCTHSGISRGDLAGRGKCLKSCRWPWEFLSLNGGSAPRAVGESGHLLARKDLTLYKQLPQLIHAGIASFKIEGRARKADFLRPIVAAFRETIDAYCADPAAYVYDARAFQRLHAGRMRDFTSSWTFGNPGRASMGVDGKREPRFFSIAIEEKDAALVDPAEWSRELEERLPPNEAPPASPLLTVRCNTPRAALLAVERGADRVLVGGEVATGRGQRWTTTQLKETAAAVRDSGARALLATPRMTTEQQVDEQRWLLEELADGAFAGVAVHNLGMLRVAREAGASALHADFSFNAFNAEAVEQLAELGARQVTLSPELAFAHVAELRRQCARPLEVIVHGNLPGMLLEHCLVAASAADCTPDDPCPAPCQARRFALRDRVGQLHPLETDQHCRNHLLMGKDLCALRHLAPFLRVGFASLRLELPFADDELVGLATQYYRRALDRFANGETALVTAEEYAELERRWPRPFSLGGYANEQQAIAAPEETLPTDVLISFGPVEAISGVQGSGH